MVDYSEYQYVLIDYNKNSVEARFSTLDKAHSGRLLHALMHPESNPLLYNENTGRFIDWRKKERFLYDKYKYNPDDYLDMVMRSQGMKK